MFLEIRAMDHRRRFLPRTEGLESRQMLSTVTPGTAAPVPTPTPTPAATTIDPNVGPLREIRIERLPQYLQQTSRDRVVPPEVITALQDNLRAIEGSLNRAPSASLRAFNLQIRNTVGKNSISVADSRVLNDYFKKILLRADANPAVAARFAQSMSDLTLASVNNSRSASLVANDYSLLLQMALGIGVKAQEAPTPTPRGPRALPGS